MVASTLAAHRPSLADIAAGDLVLRICNAPRDGQIVRLKSAKCTIGSGPHCTLRLRTRGVSPLHCLILRGPAAAVVRRWAADTRLNYQSFADAALMPGDRLSMGPIELEVVSVGVVPTTVDRQPEADNPIDSPSEADAQAELQRQDMEEERHRLEELAADLQRREASIAAAAESLNAQLTELESQRQAIDQHRQQWQSDETETQRCLDEQREQLNVRLAELEAQQNALAEERRQWETQRDGSASQAAAQAEQLNVRLAELEARQNALAEERRQWETQQDESASQAAAQTEQINAQWADVEVLRQTLEQQRQQWQAEQTEAQRRLDQQRQDIAVGVADLEALRNAFEEDRRQWERQRAELSLTAEQPSASSELVAEAEPSQESLPQEPQFEAPPEKAPVDLAEVFRRVGANVELEEEEPVPSAVATRDELPPDATRQQPAAASAKEEGEEESIDDYMNRLMQRIRSADGESGPASYTPQRSEPSRSSRGASATAPSVESPTPQPASPPPAAQRREPIEMSPRVVAPEKRIDLSALRELANLSAHSALNQHSRNILIGTMHSKLMVALVALASGAGLLWIWKELGAAQMTYYSALIALLVAIYWGMEYALLSGRLIISKSGHLDWNASPHGKIAPPSAEDDAAEEISAGGVSPFVDDGSEPAVAIDP